jgi:hypothetical protein
VESVEVVAGGPEIPVQTKALHARFMNTETRAALCGVVGGCNLGGAV